jgi:queuosine precursor transporter
VQDRTTWLIALTGTFILTLSLADLAATKFILIGGVIAPGGVFLFSIIFVVRDMLHKVAGQDYVRRTILIAAVLNLFVAAYFYFIAQLPAPEFFQLAEPWDAIFALAPAIVLASITAAVISQLLNTYVYQRLWDAGRPQWARVVGSNLVSLPVDSVLFTGLAFVVLPPAFDADPIALGDAVVRVASGQTLIKLIIVLAMTPMVYLVPERQELEPTLLR